VNETDLGEARRTVNNTLRAALLSALLLLTGCLEFDAQDVYLCFDAENDRIDALFVYRGLYAEGKNSATAMEKALSQLDEAGEAGWFAAWNNWPLQVDLTAEMSAPAAALAEHVEVENGGLFTDPKGTLCGYQFVRIQRLSAFVEKVNALLAFGVTVWKVDGQELDDDSQDLIREFSRARKRLVVVGDGRFEVRLPLSSRDHRRIRAGFWRDALLGEAVDQMTRRLSVAKRRAAGGSVTDVTPDDAAVPEDRASLKQRLRETAVMRFLADNDVSVLREKGLTTVGLGVVGEPRLHLRRSSFGLYHGSLHDALRERGDEIEDGLPAQELERRFEDFRSRGAKLLSKLAAKRR